MRIVVIGASKFGLRCLEKVMTLPKCEVVGIVTNPETFSISYRPEGVKNVLYADFRPLAEKHKIPVFVMKGKMSDPLLVKTIQKWEPDFILVVGWYHMVPRSIREIALTAGLHASLLPDYSGGAPLVWAIINGEQETGISLFILEDGVDNGNIIGQKAEPIYLNDTIATLYGRIEKRGIELIEDHLPQVAQGKLIRIKQDETMRRIMPQRHPEDGEIDWNWSALQIYNFIRAQTRPYPGAFTFYKNEKRIVWEAKLFDYFPSTHVYKSTRGGEILEVIREGPLQGILVATANGDMPLLITLLGNQQSDLIAGIDYLNQTKIERGSMFNSHRARVCNR